MLDANPTATAASVLARRPSPASDAADAEDYAHRFPRLRYRPLSLGPTPKAACSIGLGAARARGEEDPAIVVAAIAAGINVLDTAPHFHAGAHQGCVGQAVRTAIESGVCSREDLIVNATLGPVPELIEHNAAAHGFGHVKAIVESQFIAKGLLQWHDLSASRETIAPAYLRHRVAQTLTQTGLSYLDCLFVDSLAIHQRSVSPRELTRRLRGAFEMLETLCEEGWIRSYGLSTSEPLELAPILEVEARSTRRSRLRALRVGYSLLAPGLRPLIDLAQRRGLCVFATGCLDGGTPGYELPPELDEAVGTHPDAAAAIAWTQSGPGIDTAIFATRDPRHLRANLAAATLPPLPAQLHDFSEGGTP